MTLPSGFGKTGEYCAVCHEEKIYSYLTDLPQCKNNRCYIGRRRPRYGEGVIKTMFRKIYNVSKEIIGQ